MSYSHRPGRYQMQSESLGIPITVFASGLGEISVETSAGEQYLPSEIQKLKTIGATVGPELHVVKKLFQGTLEEASKLTPQEVFVREKYWLKIGE